ncbi:P22 coat - protein 5 family protein [Caldimonas brevitalea]|uniref:p22 coat-protein 5 family protein n=1 Tax=Caldimonas brevitalea TaxID=413882 RepID=A0A0G3BHL9_9BURK|nr:P22 coat - protein 5 family protein [Caldimonas brevitalea]AKJ28832.1 P22 coat - protein 5 family protein [Caldimonas brevitalea]
MANTLTRMIPDLYESLDIVSRELVGLIPSCTMDANASRAAVNQDVVVDIAPTSVASDIVPGVTAPNDGDQNIGNTTIRITKSRAVPFRWNGEEQKGVNSGAGYANIRNKQMQQAMRTLTNEVEADLAAEHIRASRAYGTPGTTPFATNLGETAQVRKILADNGSPMGDLQLVIDTTAGANMRTLSNLSKANEAGDTSLLRQGVLLDVHGFAIRESAQIKTPAKGTGAGYLVNNGAGYPIGATSIAVDTGTGTIVAGDVITFAGDANKYLVATALAGGVVVLAEPGLRQAVADNTAITVANAATRNMAFDRGALVLACRAPARPEEGDQAEDVVIVTDPRSGLSFEVALYKQYRQVRYEMSLAWGSKLIKPAHSALLLG